MLGIKCLAWDPSSGHAVSPVSPVVWISRVLRARCYARQWRTAGELKSVSRFETHPAPWEGCHCGVHALARLLFLADYIGNSGLQSLLGPRLFCVLLRASGKILQYDIGWRAEEAEIIAVGPALGFACALWGAREAADALGVPFFDDTNEMWSNAPHEIRLAPETQDGSP